MAVANLNDAATGIKTGNESIVIVDDLGDISGGRTLDVTGFSPEVIEAGHVIIRDTVGGEYKPMPVSGSVYAALPASHEYVGILKANILTAKPFAAILNRGKVNDAAAPYPIGAAVKTALPLIIFQAD
jgi:hypothetical protein